MGKNVKRLFEQFQPENYELRLNLDRKAMKFSGTVTIDGKKVGRPSQRLTFHQKGLKITGATLTKHDKKGHTELAVSRINNQASSDEVRLHAADMVYPGQYTVVLEFNGQITRPMNGIYPCFFKHDGHDKQLIATQFESHHAREAFPCIDEPEAKATFDLTLITPAGETVIANTPIKQQATEGKAAVTTFETTPRMSTYLLAFALGDLGYTEAKTKDGVLVRAYATPDKVAHAEHSLDVAVRSLEFFTDYFGMPYPLTKLDLIALPDFSSGAMENWGLITFREVAMLTDPKSSGIESKQLVALVVAHEVSHMWFGDLVTMKWWDDLWLNESFANLMEYVAVDALYPEWHIWEMFVVQEAGSAKRRDSLPDVQPVKTAVHHPDEISTLFDPSIVYAKGGTVLHMLMSYIGEAAFRKGLSAYFQKHAYGNTQADDLWAALSASSEQDIGIFMNSWLKRPGYPLVNVDWQPGQTTIALKQQRFLNDPAAASTDEQSWPTPLAATWTVDNEVFDKTTDEIRVQPDAKQPLLLNHDGQSYFLPRYANSSHLEHIVKGLKADQVDIIDRLLLLDGYTMLQRGGQADTVELLELLSAYRQERGESVWGAMAMALGEARKLIEGDDQADEQVDRLLAGLVADMAEELGWEDKPNDTAQMLRLRGLAYSLAAGAKTQSVLDEALMRFRASKRPADLPASTRGVMYFAAARWGTAADFNTLLKLYSSVTSADEKDEIASGLTAVKDPKHAAQLINLLTTDTIRRQDLMHWFVWLLRNRYSREAAWQWLTEHWDWIMEEFSSDKSFSYFARYAGMVFSRPADLKRFNTFFEPKKDIVAMARDITLAQHEITSRIAWRQRNETAVKNWLSTHYGSKS